MGCTGQRCAWRLLHWQLDDFSIPAKLHQMVDFHRPPCVQSMAWHPNPGAHVYVLPEERGPVHLIDARSHSMLCSWDCDQLFPLLKGMTGLWLLACKWAPDCGQLYIGIVFYGGIIVSF